MKLILASASPRRAQILRDAGFPFEVRASEIDECRRPGEPAATMVRRLAEAKARATVAAIGTAEPAIVIGADTTVELWNEVLGKPKSPGDARRMLSALSGNNHSVLTGLALIRVPDGATSFGIDTTDVRFATLTPEEIEDYVATGEPLDKAGAYGIQGYGGRFVERVEGSYFNVVGLPLARLYLLLKEMGWHPHDARMQSGVAGAKSE